MRYYLRLVLLFCVRLGLYPVYLIPLKRNRILFSAFGGKMYGCNAKYVFENLYHSYGGACEYIWVIDDKSQIPSEYKVTAIKKKTLGYIFYQITSKVIVISHPPEPYLHKRKRQIIINTGHGGGAYKAGGFNAAFCSRAEKNYMKYMRNIRAGLTDYVISSCEIFSRIFSSETELNIDKRKFLPIGMPRNDIMFSSGAQKKARHKVCTLIGIDEHSAIVLYAPTFRGNRRNVEKMDVKFDVKKISRAVTSRLKKDVVVLYRHHIIDDTKLPQSIDVSGYPDMQELLAAADLFITDYSSSMWDFSFTKKPGFLYTPDLVEYETMTKFHTPMENWPYRCAMDIEELCSEIMNYDEQKASMKIREHHNLLGSYENGTATSKICEIIRRHLSCL